MCVFTLAWKKEGRGEAETAVRALQNGWYIYILIEKKYDNDLYLIKIIWGRWCAAV